MAVIDTDKLLDKLSKEKADLAKTALWNELNTQLSTPTNSGSSPPAFMFWTYAEQIFRIICCNENSSE